MHYISESQIVWISRAFLHPYLDLPYLESISKWFPSAELETQTNIKMVWIKKTVYRPGHGASGKKWRSPKYINVSGVHTKWSYLIKLGNPPSCLDICELWSLGFSAAIFLLWILAQTMNAFMGRLTLLLLPLPLPLPPRPPKLLTTSSKLLFVARRDSETAIIVCSWLVSNCRSTSICQNTKQKLENENRKSQQPVHFHSTQFNMIQID